MPNRQGIQLEAAFSLAEISRDETKFQETVPADFLSHVEPISHHQPYDPKSHAKAQAIDQELQDLLTSENRSSLQLKKYKFQKQTFPSNGLVERFHRQLKDSLRCHDSTSWSLKLSRVVLGIRSSLREDLNTTTAELVYGKPLPLPEHFLRNSLCKLAH
ncbi:hypothetical protein LAZ67_X000606 [Cordylochernes scorpioides]|uniref:Integrase catalytic domain-containing protein n=1 Tax=Cordylochernes scorpioides TaxID=51811 RepID=A0ABY6LS64_9ARAC|nr:hypothetical protein LAZ67_X000606 [Cordylochernes scorpioides]